MTRAFAILPAALLIGLGWGCADEPDPWDVEMVGCIKPEVLSTPWETCSDLCEWDLAVCLEGGCDGVTVRESSNCTLTDSTPTDLGCDDPLLTGGPYKCCCDYR